MATRQTKVLVGMPAVMLEQLRREALRRGCSVSQAIRDAVVAMLEKRSSSVGMASATRTHRVRD